MVDTRHVGVAGAPFSVHVELGKVREFLRATRGADVPEGDEAPCAPPTFLMTASAWADQASLPWGDEPPSFERLLHGEQEFTFHGSPPRVGQVLTAQMRIDKVYEKSGRRGGPMRFIETVIEFRDRDTGVHLADSRATLIERGLPA